ncbi:uncharacterized protein [Atheta coriaria]|uniref:uncharacterized protein n=1 Tax=Dalotia coriaria TaxID=877792 RepID=UPI0031F3B859
MDIEQLEEIFKQEILTCYKNNDWRELLNLNPQSNNKIAYKFLWVWPSVDNLEFIARKLKQFSKKGIISIGCGCGLFEWILQQYLGSEFPVHGYEVNETWWKSRYSNPLFITHHYPSFPIDSKELKQDHILLFCYFNDGDAFKHYIDSFTGNVIIIIGPGDGRGTHTNPEPFRPRFGRIQYDLHSYQEVKNTKDYIAVYIKVEY